MNRVLALAAALTLSFTGRAAAQNCQTANSSNGNCSLSVAASLTLPTIIRLTLDDTTTDLTTPTEAIYDAGSVVTSGPVATIKTNANWTLSVRATSAVWTATGAQARLSKPASDLAWGTSPGGPFTALTTSDATVASGTRGASNVTTIHYRTAWDLGLDGPGNYSLTMVFTATAP
jgi:hypothetical protein